ncbi:MAG: hypothetical protein LBL58_12670 [Tannerellaceae bacterium]|jgi:response regulator RpfG family c-di-GMP phosphodiesterase|nr:hypothetical protein [Tannerellaceae bacterium]
MKKRILVIDENIKDYTNYIDALRTEYDVDDCGYIGTARYKLHKNNYDLIILDIMMPTLGLFPLEETTYGLRTGLVYYEKELILRPVLFWSLNSDFEKEIKNKKENDPDWNKTGFLLKDPDYKHLLNGVNHFLKNLNK